MIPDPETSICPFCQEFYQIFNLVYRDQSCCPECEKKNKENTGKKNPWFPEVPKFPTPSKKSPFQNPEDWLPQEQIMIDEERYSHISPE